MLFPASESILTDAIVLPIGVPLPETPKSEPSRGEEGEEAEDAADEQGDPVPLHEQPPRVLVHALVELGETLTDLCDVALREDEPPPFDGPLKAPHDHRCEQLPDLGVLEFGVKGEQQVETLAILEGPEGVLGSHHGERQRCL